MKTQHQSIFANVFFLCSSHLVFASFISIINSLDNFSTRRTQTMKIIALSVCLLSTVVDPSYAGSRQNFRRAQDDAAQIT